MFPLVVGTVAGAHVAYAHGGYWRRRDELLMRRLAQEQTIRELYEQTPVTLMRMTIGTATLQERLREKGLRVRFRIADRELLTTVTTKAQQGGEGQGAQFTFNVQAVYALQGDEPLVFDIIKPNIVMPNKTVGRSMVALSELREALGGRALTRTQGQAVIKDLLVNDTKAPDEVLGTLRVQVSFEQTNLAALGYRFYEYDDLDLLWDPYPYGCRYRDPWDPYYRDPCYRDRYGRRIYEGERVPRGVVVNHATRRPTVSASPRGSSSPRTVAQARPVQDQAVRTADGGQVRFENWTDPATGEERHAAVQMDRHGNTVQRVEWADE